MTADRNGAPMRAALFALAVAGAAVVVEIGVMLAVVQIADGRQAYF